MRKLLKNIWAKLSSSQKMNLIGSGLLVLSLFLNWFSDKDVFRSGDIYTGMNGPLYLVGMTLLALAAVNAVMTLMMAMKVSFMKGVGEVKLGQWQMNFGFFAMYLLVLTNSVYFSPMFGLNILNKKSEIGTMVALAAMVMICVGGYLAYRRKFETVGAAESLVLATAREKAGEGAIIDDRLSGEGAGGILGNIAQAPSGRACVATEETAAVVPVMAEARAGAIASEERKEELHDSSYGGAPGYISERDPRGKTDFERNKLYENLKKTMIRDTLSPQQRKKERLKDAQEEAFSANFGKKKTVVATVGDAGAKEEVGGKKAQMYRMDL
jgi:hypothetical protein